MSDTLKKPPVENGVNFRQEVKDFQIQLIKQALDQVGGCQRRAAHYLNIKPTTLFEIIRRYNITVEKR